MNAQAFIAKHQVRVLVAPSLSNPNMYDTEWKADHWGVTLKRVGNGPARPYTTFYSTGIGHRVNGAARPPKCASVLESLASDATCATGTFADFCSDLGYDEDSRKALATYLACQETANGLRAMLGHEGYADLLNVEW